MGHPESLVSPASMNVPEYVYRRSRGENGFPQLPAPQPVVKNAKRWSVRNEDIYSGRDSGLRPPADSVKSDAMDCDLAVRQQGDWSE